MDRVAERVKLYNMGIGNAQGRLLFTANQDTTNHEVISSSDEELVGNIQVDVDTLGHLFGDFSPALVKIDVKGFGIEVFSGAHRFLSSPDMHAVIMELNGSGVRYSCSDEQLLHKMKEYGFGTYRCDPVKRKLVSLEGKSSGSGNTLLVRNNELVAERFALAAPFVVRGQRI